MRIVFMGTPDFAVASLKALAERAGPPERTRAENADDAGEGIRFGTWF